MEGLDLGNASHTNHLEQREVDVNPVDADTESKSNEASNFRATSKKYVQDSRIVSHSRLRRDNNNINLPYSPFFFVAVGDKLTSSRV